MGLEVVLAVAVVLMWMGMVVIYFWVKNLMEQMKLMQEIDEVVFLQIKALEENSHAVITAEEGGPPGDRGRDRGREWEKG